MSRICTVCRWGENRVPILRDGWLARMADRGYRNLRRRQVEIYLFTEVLEACREPRITPVKYT